VSAYVEECRREWKRLGVPDLMADEMATDLEADLTEAQADGVSAAEILGESDPRRFAATWASERGLVSEPPPKKRSRTRFWILLALGIVLGLLLLGIVLGILGVALFATTSVGTSGPATPRVSGVPAIQSVRVPDLVGMKACAAARSALDAGLRTRRIPSSSCNAVVVAQKPTAGAVAPRHTSVTLRLSPAGS
jgi:PASTA domain